MTRETAYAIKKRIQAKRQYSILSVPHTHFNRSDLPHPNAVEIPPIDKWGKHWRVWCPCGWVEFKLDKTIARTRAHIHTKVCPAFGKKPIRNPFVDYVEDYIMDAIKQQKWVAVRDVAYGCRRLGLIGGAYKGSDQFFGLSYSDMNWIVRRLKDFGFKSVGPARDVYREKEGRMMVWGQANTDWNKFPIIKGRSN